LHSKTLGTTVATEEANNSTDSEALRPVPEIQRQPLTKQVINPAPGEMITSFLTGNTYTIGTQIGEGHFGVVFACTDVWQNELAAKVLKPTSTYEDVKTRAEAEFKNFFMSEIRLSPLSSMRSNFGTLFTSSLSDAIAQFRSSSASTASTASFWIKAISRCLLQAVHYLHLNGFVHQDIHLGNVFAALIKDEMAPDLGPGALLFKLADLGIAKLFGELQTANTRAAWMIPPEVHNPKEFGPIDHRRIDLYHVGLLLLQIASGKELRFSEQEILDGCLVRRHLL
jgi:serine/threonine protein kinase